MDLYVCLSWSGVDSLLLSYSMARINKPPSRYEMRNLNKRLLLYQLTGMLPHYVKWPLASTD